MMIIEAILDDASPNGHTAQVIFVVVRKFGWTIGSMKWVQFQFCNSWNVGIGMSWWGEWMLEFRYRSLQAPYSVLIRKFSLQKFKFGFLSIHCCVEKWLADLRKNHKSNIGNLCSILFFLGYSLGSIHVGRRTTDGVFVVNPHSSAHHHRPQWQPTNVRFAIDSICVICIAAFALW